jgi:hypothetical protein
MTIQKLTNAQKQIKRWRERRNAMVGKLLAENRSMLRAEALRQVNRILRAEEKSRR